MEAGCIAKKMNCVLEAFYDSRASSGRLVRCIHGWYTAEIQILPEAFGGTVVVSWRKFFSGVTSCRLN